MKRLFTNSVSVDFGEGSIRIMEGYSWDHQELDTIYIAALGHYEGGNYQRSASLFTALAQTLPFEEKCWRGLASSQQMLTNYAEALHAWAMLALLNDKDPWPHFHASECLLSQGDREDALKALHQAKSRLSEQDVQLKDKITLLQETYGYSSKNTAHSDESASSNSSSS